jgi:hypothetical protein
MNECPIDFCYVSSDFQEIACSFVPHGSTLPVLRIVQSKYWAYRPVAEDKLNLRYGGQQI